MCPTARWLSIAVALSMVLPPSSWAGEHLVAEAEIAERLQSAATQRADDLRTIEGFLASRIPAPARAASIGRLRRGAAALSDDDLRDLARRADTLQSDPVAGGVTKTLLILGAVLLIVVLLAALIVESCKEQGAECLN